MSGQEPKIELRIKINPDEQTDALTRRELIARENKLLIREARNMGFNADFGKKQVRGVHMGAGIDIGIVELAPIITPIITPIVTELVRWLFAYLESRRGTKNMTNSSIEIITNKNGKRKSFRISASNLSEEEIREQMKLITEFLGLQEVS